MIRSCYYIYTALEVMK